MVREAPGDTEYEVEVEVGVSQRRPPADPTTWEHEDDEGRLGASTANLDGLCRDAPEEEENAPGAAVLAGRDVVGGATEAAGALPASASASAAASAAAAAAVAVPDARAAGAPPSPA